MPAWNLLPLRRRSLGLTGGALLLTMVLGVAVSSQRGWRNRAAVLERENTTLQVAQLARELKAQSEHLVERTRELADSDAALRLVQETTDPSADRLELADLSRRGVDALLVLSASHAVRFSVAITNGQLVEQPPDPALLQHVDAIAGEPGNRRRARPRRASPTIVGLPFAPSSDMHRPRS